MLAIDGERSSGQDVRNQNGTRHAFVRALLGLTHAPCLLACVSALCVLRLCGAASCVRSCALATRSRDRTLCARTLLQ